MGMILNAKGAYGRSYSDDVAVMKDWNEGKDFKIANGPYFSSRDSAFLREHGFDAVVVPLTTQSVDVIIVL